MTLKQLLVLLPLVFLGLAAQSAPVGTAFTYQGRLNVGGAPASGWYDVRFTLYDAITNGSAVAGPLTTTAVGVSNGYFTVNLDFGSAFDGNSRWLEIAARTNGAATFTGLSPRQPLTAAPYATYAPNAGAALLASGVSTGAITSAMLADGAVTTAKIGAGAVKPANIDDGGSAAYEELLGTAKALGTTEPLPFENLSLVTTNGGSAPSLTFTLDGAGFGKVLGFVGREGISEPYEYVVEVTTTHPTLDPDAQVGLRGALSFVRNGRSTTFAGIITGCSLASYEGNGALYTFRIESPLAYLALTTDYRIYQNVTVPEMVSDLFTEVTSDTLSPALSGTYNRRESTIQFAETDLNFFSRLLEDEGIFYFFRQELEGSPTLLLADARNAYLPAPFEALRYTGNFATNPQPNTECLRSFQKPTRESTKTATINSYNFKLPNTSLKGTVASPNGRGEHYWFGSSANTKAGNDTLARARQERHDLERATTIGAGNAPDLRPGYTFTLDDRTEAGLGGSYLVSAVRHGAFRRTTNGVERLYYGNQFEVIPASMFYRPALKTPKPAAQASTAVVTGPAGEEIWTDQYGRVKVQFHWDRYGVKDDRSSAWMRVASPWAGNGWGMFFIPRMGQEVMVEFANGDPDQPVITGSFYNGINVTPYPLPAEKTKSGIKTQSSKGGGGANEIRFEDKKGAEELYLHAEKDLNLAVEHDMTSSVGNDLTSSAGHDLAISAGHNLSIAAINNLTISASQGLGINTPNDPALALNVGGTIAATNFQGSGAGLQNVPATALTGTLADARLSSNVPRLNSSQTFSATVTANLFQGNGAGLTNLSATSLTGTLADARLSSNVPRLNSSQTFSATVAAGLFQGSGAALSNLPVAALTGTINDASLSLNIARLNSSQTFTGNNAFLGRLSAGGPMGLDTLNIYGTARLYNNNLYLRDGADFNHGLGWYGDIKPFAGLNPDGPVLFGCAGGALGTACNSEKMAIKWDWFGRVGIDPHSQNAGSLASNALTFGASQTEGIASARSGGGNLNGLDFYTAGTNRLSLTAAGRVGLGTSNPQLPLHVVGSERVTGLIRVGSESSAAGPAYPTGSDGLVVRRVASTSQLNGTVVARTDTVTLTRNNTAAGLTLNWIAAPGYITINCIGLTTNNTQVIFRTTLPSPTSAGTTNVFTDAQKVVHYDISFGNTYNSGHTCHAVLDRYDDGTFSDNFITGILSSTYNQ